MDLNRESFIFHKDWYDAISQLGDDLRLELYDAIMKKAFYSEPPALSTMGSLAMSFIEPKIERDYDKWLDIKAKRKESGKQGGLAKQANATKCYQMLPKDGKSKQNVANLPVSVSVSDNVSVDNNSVILEKEEDKSSAKKKTYRFIKPTIDEINQYVNEKAYHVDGESFFNYYESKGWMIGKSPMKNWQAAVRTWERTWKNNHPQSQQDIFANANNESDGMVVNGQVYR